MAQRKKEKEKELKIPISKIDFESLVKANGYLKARQLMKRSMMEEHQDQVEKVERAIHHSHLVDRAREILKQSGTSGPVADKSLLEKIMLSNPSIKALEDTLNGSSEEKAFFHHIQNHNHQIDNKPGPQNHTFISDPNVQYSLMNDKFELLLPNIGAETLPDALTETLFLQTRYIRRFNACRNGFRTFTNTFAPQMSIYHFMYVKFMDLSNNSISRLPDSFGVLVYLEQLDLSYNRLSKLPASFCKLSKLETLNLTGNSFSMLPDDFIYLYSLTDLDLTQNLFTLFPSQVTKLQSIKNLRISRNILTHLAILPPLMPFKDMFVPTIDQKTGKTFHMNVLTREKVSHIEKFTKDKIYELQDLHMFQQDEGTKPYKRRQIWLSVCGIYEWEPVIDPNSGRIFYRNNVSGGTSWELPKSLNTFGMMTTIQEITIKNCAIKTLPGSFTQLLNLKKFIATRNRIQDLPESFGNLKNLEHLELSSNELKLLPLTVCECSALQTLLLDDNHLIRLPEEMGNLKKIQTLNLSANRLKQLPYSLGYCPDLTSIIVAENPMADPPIEEFSKGIQSVLWYLRNRSMITRSGMPPLMEYHAIGINGEVLILKPELMETVHQKLVASEKDGFLNLQLLGLKVVPKEVLKAKHLKFIKLDFNDQFSFGEEIPLELHRLKTLTLKGCKMPSLPENIFVFEKLMTLNLEENRLEWLPNGISEVLTLTNLNLSKNRLYSLPDDFYHLTNLETLNLESNYLERFPDNFELIKELKVLNISKNRFMDVPMSICSLQELRVLNVEKNKLQHLPAKLGDLKLIELRVGHNRLEKLLESLFEGPLAKSLKVFSSPENNVMELPSSLVNLHETCLVEADYNPLISPPQSLLSEGFKVVQNYLLIRANRRKLLLHLMRDEDFELSESSFSPIACEVLEDGTGFLTPDDLVAFDDAVNEYCNGEYYKCPATAEEIVERIVELREERETELYLTILRTFLSVVKHLKTSADPRFTDASIFSTQKPWGRNGELTNVWVVSLQALLRESLPTVYYEQGRPSIYNLIAEALPKISFPFTVDLLKDSLRLYISPYGPIADTEQVVFPSCDCVDDKKGKPKRHDPCTKAAVVISKSIYIEEEADRREVEEDEFLERFNAVEDDVRIWLVTDEGRKCLEKEVKARKAALKEEINLREEMILSQQMKYKKALDVVKNLQTRFELFQSGAAIESHGFESKEHAQTMIADAQQHADTFTERVDLLKESIMTLKEDLATDWKTCLIKAAEDLVQKYCVLSHAETVSKYRKEAATHNWNRHWDGEEGAAFEEWKSHHTVVRVANVNHDGADTDDERLSVKSNNSRPNSAASVRSTASRASSRDGSEGELAPEYDWKDTAKMDKFRLPLFLRYRNENPFTFVPR